MNRKKLITIILALVAVCCGVSAKNKVIDRPAFKSTSTSSLYPVKVELTKTATIVHFHMNCAHWRDWSMDGARSALPHPQRPVESDSRSWKHTPILSL